MISKIKALGLVLAAAFAVSAVAAPAAMAEEETKPAHFFSHATNKKTHLRGVQHGAAGENVFTIPVEGGNLTVECPNEEVSFTGTPSNTEGKTEQGDTFTDVRVHPVYSPSDTVTEHVKNCPVKIGETNFGKAYVHTEGCDYILSAHTDTDANTHAPVHIKCESTGEGEAHEITITAALGCVIHVGTQTPKGGVHYTVDEADGNTASGKEAVTVDATVREIHATVTNCPGVPETVTNATYDSKITVKGYEDKSSEEGPTEGNQVSIKWTETAE